MASVSIAKKVAIVYYSLTGNTRKLAGAIAKGINSGKNVKAELIDITLLKHKRKTAMPSCFDNNVGIPSKLLDKINSADILFIGSGIYAWDFGRPLLKVLSFLKNTRLKPAYIFFSSGAFPTKFLARHAISILKQKSFSVKGVFKCTGLDMVAFLKWFGGINKGHPDALDIKHAEMFARKMV